MPLQKVSQRIRKRWTLRLSQYHLDLVEANIKCCRDRVLRLMQGAKISAQRGYKNQSALTHSGDIHKAAPNQWWVSDITYIHTHQGFLFLVVIMDLYARNIVGWSMLNRMTDDLVLDALTMAYGRRKPTNTVKLHSDQGRQYTSLRYKKLLATLNIEQSMSRRGNCWAFCCRRKLF